MSRSPAVGTSSDPRDNVSSLLANIIKTDVEEQDPFEETSPVVENNLAGKSVRIFDPQAFVAALDEDEHWDDNGFVGPQDERPAATPRSRTTEDEVWARIVRKIIADPQSGDCRVLIGDEDMVGRLRAATATMPHFSAVTGIIERAVLASAYDGETIRFPPILMLSDPGLGKGF